jgi:transcriptional regulator with GAF, ATPase, and Fis domain
VGLAAVHTELEALEDAWEALKDAVPVLEATGDARTAARALNQMGLVRRRQGDAQSAADLHQRAREAAARAGDLRQQAVALRNLAGLDRLSGQLERAVERLSESVELQRADGDRRGVALILRQIRTLQRERGQLELAWQAVSQELELRESLGEEAAVAATLLEGARLARLLGHWSQAEVWLGRAVELRAHMGDLEGTGKALLEVARTLLETGRPRAARRKLEAARDAVGEQGPVDLRAQLWTLFAATDLALLDAYVFEDDPHLAVVDEARLDDDVTTDDVSGGQQLVRRAGDQAQEARELSQQSSSPALLGPALEVLARAQGHSGRRDSARDWFRQSLSAAEECQLPAHDLGGRYTCYLSYGTWLGRQVDPGSGETADVRVAVDYLERAALLASEANQHGVAADHAARAYAALGALRLRQGQLDEAQGALERAVSLLGAPTEARGSARALLRQGIQRLAARATAGDTPGPGSLLKNADEAARHQLARLSSQEELRDALLNVRRLQELVKALNSELDLERLLSLIIDAAIELMGAERGFLILTEGGQEVAFKVARNIERAEVERPDRKVSNTIALQAIDSNAAVVTGDASSDARFAGALSVAEQRLRSVACVPLRVKGTVTGAIYLDHRYKEGLFGEHEVELLESLADHAAVALFNARMLRANTERAAELAAERERLKTQVESQSLELAGIRERLAEQSRADGSRYRYDQIVGNSAPMLEVFRLLDKVIGSTIPVFIHGESGTGKELIARAIHYNGPRSDGPFVSENFAAIVDELLESELFGHVKGSFTGATDDKKGLFERANGGTVFLDEIGDLSDKMQKELLRVLEEREVRPVGASESIPVDVRLVSATHRDLKKMVAEGTFRQDLFYRLHVFGLELPPLRERRDDIPLLVERFLLDYASQHSEGAKRFEPAALRKLMTWRWPGNVRELKNFVDRTALLAKGEAITADEVEFEQRTTVSSGLDEATHLHWSEAKEAFARHYITTVLRRVDGNVSVAARETGMLRQAFQRLVKRYGIDPAKFRGKR